MLGSASSRLEISVPVADNWEPLLDNWEQGLEPVHDIIDPDDRVYEGQSQESQQSHQENKLVQHEYDEDLFADWGGGHNDRSGMRSVTRKLRY